MTSGGLAVPHFFSCFLFCALCHHCSAFWRACGAALSAPLPSPHFISYVSLSSCPAPLLTTLSQPLSNAHTRDSGRERDRERENPSFFERKLLKPQRNKESSPRANSSGFSLLKCKGEKRCCWEPPLFQNAAALQHRRDVMGSWENLVPWCPHVPWLWLGQQVAFI